TVIRRALVGDSGRVGQRSATHRIGPVVVGCAPLTHPTSLSTWRRQLPRGTQAMASVDPYSPCPCGSGQKFKWCCHKVEAVADRAQRLYSNGQTDLAIEVLDDGLRKDPGNAWLLTRKAMYLLSQEKLEPAKGTLRVVLQNQPKHLGALILMTRLELETEGP